MNNNKNNNNNNNNNNNDDDNNNIRLMIPTSSLRDVIVRSTCERKQKNCAQRVTTMKFGRVVV